MITVESRTVQLSEIHLNPDNPRTITDDTRKRLSIAHRGLKYPTRSGPNHHFWKGGITSENEKHRKSADYKNWRIAVFEKDLYTCQDCGKEGGYLHAHHIKKFSKRPDLRFNIDNGETLCMDCHAKRHGLVFSRKPLNQCLDCGKRIKISAKRCLSCSKKHTLQNRNKCMDCGTYIDQRSIRCRSCSAKINIAKTGYVNFWEFKKRIKLKKEAHERS